MEIVMPILKSLTFTNLPDRSRDPVANRRAKLVSRLEEQRQLLQDPSYVRVTQRWAGKGDERRHACTIRAVKISQNDRLWNGSVRCSDHSFRPALRPQVFGTHSRLVVSGLI
jgi:hypothetical protein